jgi:hypothetical protein
MSLSRSLGGIKGSALKHHVSIPSSSVATPSAPGPRIAMLFAYLFDTLVVLVLGSVIPTSSMYTELFVSKKDARTISGVLVAAFNVGSAIAQPIQGYCIFNRWRLNRVYALFCIIVLVGCLIAGASYKRSLVTLFLGRLCTGVVAGQQLFEYILNATVRESNVDRSIRVLMTVIQLSYMLGFIIAAITLAAAPLETDNNDIFPVNALTWPYYIAAAFAGILFLGSFWGLRGCDVTHTHSSNGGMAANIHVTEAVLGLVGIAVNIGAPALFVIGGFIINEESWKFTVVELSLIIAGLYFLSSLTILLDRFFEGDSRQWRRTALSFATPILLLGVVPWKGLAAGVSFSTYFICKPLLALSTRISYAGANKLVLDYAKAQPPAKRTLWIVLSGVALEVGLGISLSLGTLFAPEPTGALIVIGLALVYACAKARVTHL